MSDRSLNEINDCSAPQVLDHFVGQERVKRLVQVALEASWMDGSKLPHMLFTGYPGLGKSELAAIIAKEMGSELQEEMAQNLTSISDIQAFLLQAKDKSILLLDELDTLQKSLQVTLYKALENGKIFVTTGAKKQSTSIRLNNFTFIACTNWTEYLMTPLLSRFKLVLPFTLYTTQELKCIFENRCRRLGWEIQSDVFSIIASRSRGTPRNGLRLLESTRRTARAEGAEAITVEHVFKTLEMEGIDEMGLTEGDRQYISIIADQGNITRLNVISTCMSQSSLGIVRHLEPYLISSGLVTKDPRTGCRMLTSKGLQYVQDRMKEKSQ